MAKIILIAAVGKNLELGKNNNLIWKLKEDMQFFKNETINKTIVMGYNTFKSLPGLLNKRNHIILTHKKIDNDKIKTFDNFNDLKNYLDTINDDIYIIGGGAVYKLFLECADELVLTEIDEEDKSADVYFPKFDKNNWNKTIIKEIKENNITYSHVKYLRKK